MSCNGCRILRKGCSETCTLKPCLQWIRSPDSQANATLFLAKFYGRAGLINLISDGPDHLRPEIFRSLLYEACGRIINPIYGSVGLLWTGNWLRCQEAVEAVLKGTPIMQLSLDCNNGADPHPIMPLQGCDIRHISRDTNGAVCRRDRAKKRFNRSSLQDKSPADDPIAEFINEPSKFSITGWDYDQKDDHHDQYLKRASSHDSSSVETVEPSLVNFHQPVHAMNVEPGSGLAGDEEEVFLELSLGMNRVFQSHLPR